MQKKNRALPIFFIVLTLLTIWSFAMLDVDWSKLIRRIPDIGKVFGKLAHFRIDKADMILTAFTETISITVLSTFFSALLGLLFGMLAAENVFHLKPMSVFIKCFFTFLRAVPTPVWVLLMLVCFGFGPMAGIMGLCIHTIAFFTKSFSQSFEDISVETIEALAATGASKVQIFTSAMLPSAFSQIIAWIGMRFEINFSECAILGMVGAGGIGYVISTNLQAYDYGTAGVAILGVFLFAYLIERMFVKIKAYID